MLACGDLDVLIQTGALLGINTNTKVVYPCPMIISTVIHSIKVAKYSIFSII
jgi:hypothetical protein